MAISPLTGNKFRVIFWGWWLAWSIVHFSVIWNFGFTDIQALADSLVSNILLAACCLLITNNMRFYLPRQERYWYVLAISFGLSCLWLLVIRLFLWLFFKGNETYTSMLFNSSAIRLGIAFLMTGCMAMMSLLWYTLQEQTEADARKTDAEKLTREAELYKLRQQLQPHFLFNSLNSINALIGSRPEEARKMIQQLSDFLRGTLKKEEHQWISLSEEMQYLELYLDIEKVRFGNRLSTNIQVDEAAGQLKIPALLLQPVVENAIKFGLYDTTGEVIIEIKVGVVENNLMISVENPFDPETSHPRRGTGFGLSSIKRRLDLLFARNDLLVTTVHENTFTTTIKVPQHE